MTLTGQSLPSVAVHRLLDILPAVRPFLPAHPGNAEQKSSRHDPRSGADVQVQQAVARTEHQHGFRRKLVFERSSWFRLKQFCEREFFYSCNEIKLNLCSCMNAYN